MTPAEIRKHEADAYARRLAGAGAFDAARRAYQRERDKNLVHVEPCHESCLEAEVARAFEDAGPRYAEMIREHYRRRVEWREVVVPRNDKHRRAWRQKYGTDPSPPNDGRHPEDDYACRFSGFTGDGAAQIRRREGLIRTGQVGLMCLQEPLEAAS